MNHTTLLQQKYPEQDSLEKVIELLLSFVLADSIYFSSPLEEEGNEGIIIVIIGKHSPHDWDDLTDYCWKIFESYPQFSFRIFGCDWVKEELKNGNPFFVMHCSSKELVYTVDDRSTIFFTEKLKPKRFLKKAKCRYQIDNQTSFAAGLNVRHYKHGKDYLQAAYALHQSIKFLFITASGFLTGEWLVDQELETQQKHISKFSNTLGKVFDHDKVEDVLLLECLSSACCVVQGHQETVEISLQLIEAAEAKWEWMKQEVQRLFTTCICRCKHQFSLESIPLIAINEKDPLQLITTIITDSIETLAIYCFGKRSINRSLTDTILEENKVNFENNHYYLFVIVNQYVADAAANLADSIKTQTGGQHTATVLLHKKTSLKQRRGDQQHFFYQVMERGQLLFQNNAQPPYLPYDETPCRSIESARRYLEQRNKTKHIFIEAESMDGGSSTKVNVFMMHIVLEQTCLGLIRLFLGYFPNHFSLVFLFDLCEYFTPLTAEIFPRQTDKDKVLLKILSCPGSSLRYGFIDDVSQHDYEVLCNRYHEFVERADAIATKELERLEEVFK
ncbi:hypothetical protein [uncultured Flavobacterium sp.]|uniref:hypothetical protein n=1 Tax=uncultured Flavobacterium sp. TaxID=165435 RepID=UPI0030EDF2FE|tara:strand:+ start:1497 stop:3176 length:1680 start_codon:yes stop_codon:yes gene_type:complete